MWPIDVTLTDTTNQSLGETGSKRFGTGVLPFDAA